MIERNGWEMLIIPAIATEAKTYKIGPAPNQTYRRRKDEVLLPDREPKAVLDEMRRAIGSMNFAAQYQQDPIPAEGNAIQRSWLKFYDEEPEEFDITILSFDLASTIRETSSYSVGQLWGKRGSNFYLLDTIRGRYEAPELRRRILRAMRDWGPNATVVEETELGRSMVQEIRSTTDLRPQLERPRQNKEARLQAHAPRFEEGEVWLPRDAPWLDAYVHELLAFPYGRQDDQVDATSLALYYLTGLNRRRGPLVRRNPIRRNIERSPPTRS